MIETNKWKCERCGSVFDHYNETLFGKCDIEICPSCGKIMKINYSVTIDVQTNLQEKMKYE